MSSANTLTGRNGKFVVGTTLVARTTNWDLSTSLASSTEWGDSDCGGWTARAAGRRDATFNASGKYSTNSEQWDIFQPGDNAIATLWLNATSLYYDFPRALCSSFDVAVNIDSEEVIGWSSSWGADGEMYFPGKSGAETRTLPS